MTVEYTPRTPRLASSAVLAFVLVAGCDKSDEASGKDALVEKMKSEMPDSCKEHYECKSGGCNAFCLGAKADFDAAKAVFEKHCKELSEEKLTTIGVQLGTEQTTELDHQMSLSSSSCGDWKEEQTF